MERCALGANRSESTLSIVWKDTIGHRRETPLRSRVTSGVVRVGETVRKPLVPPFAVELLRFLEQTDFDGAPRVLGRDEHGRTILTYVPGEVVWDLDGGAAPDEQLVGVARLIRCFHDATAGSRLAGRGEVVCHNDLSPDNTVYRGGRAVALIDFDNAAPGRRIDDVAYTAWLYLDLTRDSRPPTDQRRRLRVFAEAYGLPADRRLVDVIGESQRRNIARLERTLALGPPGVKLDFIKGALEWNRVEADWFKGVRAELLPG